MSGPRFFLGTHQPGWLSDSSVALFISDRRLRQVKRPRPAVCDWALDSGGFTELATYGSWDHGPGPAEYVDRIRRYQQRIGRLQFALRRYATREGHPVVPGTHRDQFAGPTVGLGQWVSLQRFKHRRGELDERYVRWLEALPGWQWEVELATRAYGEPIDLDGHPHGTAKGIAAGCPCKDCLDERRARDRMYLARRRELRDPVRAGYAVHRITVLENAGVKRTAIVAASGVPLGVIRKVMAGEWTELERDHERAIRALTVEACRAVDNRVGSRGRLVATANERIPAGPTWEILADLDRRGFGRAWVARELGYLNGMQIGRDVVSRRIADQIAALAGRVGDLTYPRVGNRRVPPLSELLQLREVVAA